MEQLQLAQDLVTTLVILLTTAGWPPFGMGAFCILLGVFGVVSVLFDDETPRGIPGIEYLNQPKRELSAKAATDRKR